MNKSNSTNALHELPSQIINSGGWEGVIGYNHDEGTHAHVVIENKVESVVPSRIPLSEVKNSVLNSDLEKSSLNRHATASK